MTEIFSFDDPLLDEVRKMKEDGEEISISILQHKFRIGYIRAVRLIKEVGLKPKIENSLLRSRR
jgi:DNA segregation ATPase FtsK/SpoIIIE-like protein